MEPKYALSQGVVKKKKHKNELNTQKKSSGDSANSRQGGQEGSWNPVKEVPGGLSGRGRGERRM
jgi:hypothetical protein